MMYGRKNVCLDPFYPLAKFEQNRKTFLPRLGQTRHGRHAFETPNTRKLCVLSKKNYQTKNDHLLYKFNVLKFGVDSFIDIKGRPLFVRVTLFLVFLLYFSI